MNLSNIKFLLLSIAVLIAQLNFLYTQNNKAEIVDSDLNFVQATKGTNAPKAVLDSLCLVNVKYYSFDGKIHKGQLVVHKLLRQDVEDIFNLILQEKFPVAKVIPIVKYLWSDEASMEDNNSSSFNYRFVAGTKRISNHALGRAVDINPFNNPVIYESGRISPGRAKYDTTKPGTFSKNNVIVQEFLKRGWRWGGNFNSFKDNHHFDK